MLLSQISIVSIPWLLAWCVLSGVNSVSGSVAVSGVLNFLVQVAAS